MAPISLDSHPEFAYALSAALAKVFPRSTADSRRALAANATVRTFPAGDVILHQGDDSSILVVLDGHLAIRRTTIEGRRLITLILTRGGLASVLPLSARPAGADLVALTPISAAILRAQNVRSLAAGDPGLAMDLLDNVLGAFEELLGRVDGLMYQGARRRVARILHLYADLFFTGAPVLTRSHLPELVGTSREMTGRVLRALEAQGLVARVGRSGLALLDPAGLEALAAVADGDLGGREPRIGTSSDLEGMHAAAS
jgi:CRP/FNR family transcriptional regulator